MQVESQQNRELFRQLIESRDRVIVELGSGPAKKAPGSIGVDLLPLAGVDIVHNLEEGLGFIPDNSVDEIASWHVLEHITNFEQLMREVHRVLKPTGVHRVTVPHFTNPHYYSDWTHKRFFGLYTFDYFAKKQDQSLSRTVPDFYVDFHFKVTHRQFNFKRNLAPRNLINRYIASPVFNSSNWWKEMYEDKFCFLFPTQEMYYEMMPVKQG